VWIQKYVFHRVKETRVFDTSDIQNCYVLLLIANINRTNVGRRVSLQNVMNDQVEVSAGCFLE